MFHALVVSDDKTLVSRVREALDQLPVKILKVCVSTKDCLDMMHSEAVHLVIVDYFVPENCGVDVVKTLKQVKEDVIFVLLNRVRTRSVIDRAFRFGANDVLPYPLDGDILRETLIRRVESYVPIDRSADT
jgi:CitB family two-component system response regulator MalR